MADSKDYIFKNTNGKLDFIGDFEGFYQTDEDPWCQSGQGDMARYYQKSRQRILNKIDNKEEKSLIIEVGCGLGHFTNQIKVHHPTSEVFGVDLSQTAIIKAQKLFSDPNFFVCNAKELSSQFSRKSVDVVILNQLLWYIVDDIEEALSSIRAVLKQNGLLIISNAFAREQKYGLEKLPYFDGTQRFLANMNEWQLISAEYYDDNETHTDGHFQMRPLHE